MRRKIRYTTDFTKAWKTLKDTSESITHLTGLIETGPLVIDGGKELKFWKQSNYGSDKPWIKMAPLPFKVLCMAGSNMTGPIISSAENPRVVAYMNSYSENQWKIAQAHADFDIKIMCMVNGVGNKNASGVYICGGRNNQDIAYGEPPFKRWNTLKTSPISIMGMTGDSRGIIAYTHSLTKETKILTNEIKALFKKPNKEEWGKWETFDNTEIAGTEHLIKAITGNTSRGPIVLTKGNKIYMKKKPKNETTYKLWTAIPKLPRNYNDIIDISGEIEKGLFCSVS